MYQNHVMGKNYPGTNYRQVFDENGNLVGLARRVNAAIFGRCMVWAVYKNDSSNGLPKFYKTMEDYRMGLEYVF